MFRFQFRIAGLIVLTIVVVLACVAYNFYRSYAEMAEVVSYRQPDELFYFDARVTVLHAEAESTTSSLPMLGANTAVYISIRPGAEGYRDVLQYFPRAQLVTFVDIDDFPREWLDDLKTLPDLHFVSFMYCNIEDDDLMALRELRQLRGLEVLSERVTDEGKESFRAARPDVDLSSGDASYPSFDEHRARRLAQGHKP